MKNDHASHIKRIRIQNAAVMQQAEKQLQADIEALKGALGYREHIKAMTDLQLATRF
jgi:hypothetical protein